MRGRLTRVSRFHTIGTRQRRGAWSERRVSRNAPFPRYPRGSLWPLSLSYPSDRRTFLGLGRTAVIFYILGSVIRLGAIELLIKHI